MAARTLARIGALLLAALIGGETASACADGRVALREVHARWSATGDDVEAVVAAARRLRLCTEASLEDRLVGHAWESYLLFELDRLAPLMEQLEYFFEHLAPFASPEDRVSAHRKLAVALRRAGRPLEAIHQNAAALALADALPAGRRADVLLDFSVQYAHLGEYRRALALAKEAEAVAAPEGGLVLARAQMRQASTIAMMSHLAHRPDEALAREGIRLAERAREVVTRHAAVDAEEAAQVIALAETARARLLLLLGHLAEADRAAAQAVTSARIRNRPPVLLPALLVMADVDLAHGRIAQATRTLAEAQQLADDMARWLARIHLLMARAHIQTGHAAAAEARFRASVAALERQRAELGLTEYALFRLPVRESAYREFAALLLRQGRHEEAFQWLHAERARYLRDVRQAARLAATPAAGVELQRLHAQLRLATDSVRAAGEGAPLALVARVSRLRAEIARASGYVAAEPLVDIEALQQRLRRDGRVLLAYYLEEPAHAFVVKAGAFHAVPLAHARDEIIDAWAAAHPRVAAGDGARGETLAVRPEPLQRLYQMLFAPVEPFVPRGAPVTVVMDRDVGQIPFAMLLTGDAAPFQFEAWPFLLYRNAFSVELAAALMLEDLSPRQQPLPLVAIGKSRFGDDPIPEPFRASALAPLPHVATEVRAIARRFSGAMMMLNEHARESRLYALLPQVDVLHLATHAFVSEKDPLFSAIVLTPDPHGAGPDGDGILYLYELAGRRLDASLVVLSGCSTARGEARLGEGVIGLHYGFRAAGARASLAALWPIEDAATARVMRHFYRHLARGLPKDEALRLAQIDYIRASDREGANPFFWAAPVLAGDTSPIDLHRSPLSPRAWAALASILLLGAFLTRRIRRSPDG